MKSIDVHTHLFSDQVISRRENCFHDREFRELYKNPKSCLIGYRMLLESMDMNDVEKSFCLSFPWENPEDCDRENDCILESADHSGGRLVPFGMVSEKEKDPGLKVRELAKRGFYGIGEIAFYHDGLIEAKERFLSSVFNACREEMIAVMIHMNEPVGRKYPGKTNTDFDFLIRLISEFQGLNIICAHWGGGLFAHELVKGVGDIFANVYYDCAASPFVYDRKIYATAVSAIGVDRILFGSDYPLITPGRYFDEMNEITEEIRQKIAYDNARNLLNRLRTK